MNKKITVIGSFVMDIVATMKSFPLAGQSVLGDTINFYAGGKGANQCVAVARLGGKTEMIGMLGKDANGKIFKDILAEEGIESDYVFECDKPTSVAQVQIDSEGQNRICMIPSANHEFDFCHVEAVDDKIKNSGLIVLQLELKIDVTRDIINRAYGYGVPVLLNPAPAACIGSDILSKVKYLTPNESELSMLSGLPIDTDEQLGLACEKLFRDGVGCVIATLGERGAYIYDKEGGRLISGYKVKAIDTVAAGDSFNGAFAVAVTEGKTVDEAVRFANAMGALTVGVKGAIPSLHTRKQLEEFLLAQNAK